MCFGGLVFQSKPPQLLQVQFFVLATNFAFKGMLGVGKVGLTAAQGVAQHGGNPELVSSGGSLKLSCRSLQGWEESGQLCFLDEGCSTRHCRHFLCFTLVWAMCWHGPDLCGGNARLQGLRDPGAGNEKYCPGITVPGQERLLKHVFIHGEKYLLLGVLLPWVLLWRLTQMTPGKQILRLFSAGDTKKEHCVLGSSGLAFCACMRWS